MKVLHVTVGVVGTEKIHERTPWKRTIVRLEVLDVLSADEVCSLRTSEIGKHVQTTLSDWLDAPQNRLDDGEIHQPDKTTK